MHPQCLAWGLGFRKQPIECVLNSSTEDSNVCEGRCGGGGGAAGNKGKKRYKEAVYEEPL